MRLLHIDSGILGDNSVSRAISAAAVARLRVVHDGVEVQYRHLAASPISHLSGPCLAGQAEQRETALDGALAQAAQLAAA